MAHILADAVSAAMLAGDGTLSVFDADTGDWERRTWREVHARAERIGAQLLTDSAGRAPGAVGLIGDPTHDLVAAVQGAWLAGTAVSILPGPMRGADPQRWAEDVCARFVGIGVDLVLGTDEKLDLLAAVPGGPRICRVEDYGRHADPGVQAERRVDPQTPAVLQGTAGSTGEPRTAVLSARAVLTNLTELIDRFDLRPGRDVQMTWLPLYHDMGLIVMLMGMASGCSQLLAANSAFAAAPFRWLTWLSQSRATFTAAPNFAYDLLGMYPSRIRDVDLSNLRLAVSGGEPIDPDGFDRFLDAAAAVGMKRSAAAPAYGMAESTCAVSAPAEGDGPQYDEVTVTPVDGGTPYRHRYALLGPPLPGMQVRVVEEAGDAVPRIDGRRVGHIEIRGTSLMTGYLGHPPLEPDAWLRTGDLGYLLDGRPVICGRSKEVVMVAGRNLFPVEIERCAAGVRGVRSGRVVALARSERSARPGLVIVAEFRGADADSARREVVSTVAATCHVVPADVVFVGPGTLPLTTSGKLRRLQTKELLETGRLG